MKRALALALLAGVLVGCSGDDSETTATESVTLPALTTGKVYWLRDGQVWPSARELAATNTAAAALEELFAGPTEREAGELGATTGISGGSPAVSIEGGVARVEPQAPYSAAARAQIVYTLTQFPEIESVEFEGETYTRTDFEEQTPSVLVESPLPFEEVVFPLTASGTANTFEATFQYELVAPNGKVVFEDFVTATSGTGTRGTFEFTTAALDDPAEGEWKLVVFETSAEDGSRRNEVEIPLAVAP